MTDHKSIQEAMVAIMAEVEPIAKDRQADRYKFRGVDDVYKACQLFLAGHGVFTTSEVVGLPDYSEYTTAKGGLTFRTRAVIRYHFHHVSGTSVASDVIGEGMDTGDKASNKAMSVAHKYALLQALMIPTSDAKDPENDEHEVTTPTPAQRPAPGPAPNPSPTHREQTIALVNEHRDRLSKEQLADLKNDLAHAGTTTALLNGVREKLLRMVGNAA